jgi:hypothetical protein
MGKCELEYGTGNFGIGGIGTWNEELEEMEIENWELELETGSKEQGTGNREHGTGDWEFDQGIWGN